MKMDDISRRDFGKLSLAAFGGLVAGIVAHYLYVIFTAL